MVLSVPVMSMPTMRTPVSKAPLPIRFDRVPIAVQLRDITNGE